MDDSAGNVVLSVEDWLIEKVEEGLFALLDVIVFPQFELRNGDLSAIDLRQVCAHVDSDRFEVGDLLLVLYLVHEVVDFVQLLVGRFDGLLGDLFPPHFVKVFGNSRHQHQLGDQIGGPFGVFALRHEERLLQAFDGDVVLGGVVVDEGALVFEDHRLDLLEVDVYDLVVPRFAVVAHHDSIDDGLADQVPLFFFVLVLVLGVDGVDGLQDCVTPHNLL